MNINLFLNGQAVELGPDAADLALTYQSEPLSPSGLSARGESGGYSTTLELPATPHNQQVLGPLFDPQVDWKQPPQTADRMPCRLESGPGVVLLEGDALLKQVKRSGPAAAYVLELRGFISQWVRALENTRLQDLQGWDPPGGYLYFSANQVAADIQAAPVHQQGRVPDPYTPNSSQTDRLWWGLVDYGDLTADFDTSPTQTLQLSRLRPGLLVRGLLFELFRHIGWRLNANALDFPLGPNPQLRGRGLALLFTRESWLSWLPGQWEPKTRLQLENQADFNSSGYERYVQGAGVATKKSVTYRLFDTVLQDLNQELGETTGNHDWPTGIGAHNLTSQTFELRGPCTLELSYDITVEVDQLWYDHETLAQNLPSFEMAAFLGPGPATELSWLETLYVDRQAQRTELGAGKWRHRWVGKTEIRWEQEPVYPYPLLRFYVAFNDGSSSGPTPGLTVKAGNTLTVRAKDSTVQPGQAFWPRALAPNFNGLELVADLARLFNLYVTGDPQTRRLTLLPYNEFFPDWAESTQQRPQDWTDRLDMQRPWITEPANHSLPRKLRYTWAEADDRLNETYRQRTGRPYGSLEQATGLAASNTETGGVELQILAPTRGRYLTDTRYSTEWQDLFVPVLRENLEQERQTDPDDQPYATTDWTPRLALVSQKPSELDNALKLLWPDGSVGGNLGVRPPAYLFEDPQGELNLRFDSVDNGAITGGVTGAPGVFHHFHQEAYRARLYGQVVSCWVYLDPHDILARDFQRPLRIGNQLYRLLEIRQYRPARHTPTRVRLLKL